MRYNTELTVHLENLKHNYNLLKERTPNNETIFMVKADAYGHGLLPIVYYSFHELGIKRFGCASLGEAMSIRETYPTMQCELWVFSDTELDADKFKDYYLDFNIIPVIHNIPDLKAVLSDKDFNKMPLTIKFNTGLHRLGISEGDTEEVISLLKNANRDEIFHLLTHFSSSFKKIKPKDKTHRQYESFKSIKNKIKEAGISIRETSCSNSGAIEQGVGLDETHIRPGIMMYGPKSVLGIENPWQGKTISTFKTKIIKVVEVKRGTPIGYGGHVCGKNGFLTYLPVGYGDGILTYFSGAKFNYFGKESQFLGRINMDITAVFFEELPKSLAIGDEFSIWDDKDHDVLDLATQLKTIPYQLFTAVSNRVPRRYLK